MAFSDFFDNPQKSLTIVVVIAVIGVAAANVLGFFYAAKSPEVVSSTIKIFEAILIGAVGGKLALAQPGNNNNNKQ